MTHWLYIYEPTTGRRLLLVNRDGVVTVYWRGNTDAQGRRPVGVEEGDPRWRVDRTLDRGKQMTIGALTLVHLDDGHLYVEGSRGRGSSHAQLLQRVEAGIGEPTRLDEVWA